MSELETTLKKYWPYAVGLIVGLIIVMKYMGSGSSSTVAASTAASGMDPVAAQYALGQQQLAQQATEDQQNYSLNSTAITAQANASEMAAQATLAQAAGATTSEIIGSLYQPTIAAINTAAYSNGQAMSAAAEVAANGFNASTAAVQTIASTTGAAASAVNSWGAVTQGLAQMRAAQGPSNDQMLIQGGTALGMAALAA